MVKGIAAKRERSRAYNFVRRFELLLFYRHFTYVMRSEPVQQQSQSYSGDLVLSGRLGVASFINGIYHCLEQPFEGKPAYKHESVVPPEFPLLAGRSLFIYFHSGNRTWTIAMDVGSLEVIAFGVGDVASPLDVGDRWFISESQEYVADKAIRVFPVSAGMDF
jgi:hypothetical protein